MYILKTKMMIDLLIWIDNDDHYEDDADVSDVDDQISLLCWYPMIMLWVKTKVDMSYIGIMYEVCWLDFIWDGDKCSEKT